MTPAINPNSTFGRKQHTLHRSSCNRRISESAKASEYNWEKNPEFTPDRGTGFYEKQRKRLHKASLVESGKHAGRSRVSYKGSHQMLYHLWFRDFFTSVTHLKLKWVILITVFICFALFFMFAGLYYIIDTLQTDCFDDEVFQNKFVNYYIFSMVTQQTIGYGVRSPKSCWLGSLLISFHSVVAMLLDSIFLGIIFVQISYPRRRGRSIFLSDSAIVARRDGVLKFMFRLADVRPTTVMSPNVRCHLYTFGHGRKTAEGEFIPVRVQEMLISYIDGNMLLPVTVEHTIDERSPLYGHSRETLDRMGMEIVVSFEATNEFGDIFSARQSYLPNEIHWGCVFCQIIFPCDGLQGTQHIVDLTKFHDVEPQEQFMNKARTIEDVSRKVISYQDARDTIPSSLLGENTIVLSDCLCIMFRDRQPLLGFRVGDSYSHQLLEVNVRALIYRWDETTTREGELTNMQMQELTLEPSQLFLKYPCLVLHHIDENSPISKWVDPQGLAYDALAEVVVVVEAVQLISSSKLLKQKTYKVQSQIKYGYTYEPMMIAPNKNSFGVPIVEWEKFHQIKQLPSLSQQTKQEVHKFEIQQPTSGHVSPPLPFSYRRYHNLGSRLSSEEAIKEQLKVRRISKKRSNSNPEFLQMVQMVAKNGNQERKYELLQQLCPTGCRPGRRYSSFEHGVSESIEKTPEKDDATIITTAYQDFLVRTNESRRRRFSLFDCAVTQSVRQNSNQKDIIGEQIKKRGEAGAFVSDHDVYNFCKDVLSEQDLSNSSIDTSYRESLMGQFSYRDASFTQNDCPEADIKFRSQSKLVGQFVLPTASSPSKSSEDEVMIHLIAQMNHHYFAFNNQNNIVTNQL